MLYKRSLHLDSKADLRLKECLDSADAAAPGGRDLNKQIMKSTHTNEGETRDKHHE